MGPKANGCREGGGQIDRQTDRKIDTFALVLYSNLPL